jgi:uridine kinase
MEDISIFWYLAIAFIVGAWLWARRIKRDIQELEVQIKEVMSKIVFMRTETHNDIIFAYNAFNDEFICQGKDMEDLNVQFGKRFPDRKGIIVKPDEEVST